VQRDGFSPPRRPGLFTFLSWQRELPDCYRVFTSVAGAGGRLNLGLGRDVEFVRFEDRFVASLRTKLAVVVIDVLMEKQGRNWRLERTRRERGSN